MIGIVLIAHAKIASETQAAVEYILKAQPYLSAVDVVNSDQTAEVAKQLSTLLDELGQTCDGVLVMADIFGATPCNIAMNTIAASAHLKNIELVAGFNLPSVIKAVLEREQMDANALAQTCMDAGAKYMRLGSQEAVVQKLFTQSKAA